LHFEIIEALFNIAKLRFQLCIQAGVFLGQFCKGAEVSRALFQRLKWIEHGVQDFQLSDDLLGFFLIIPEAGLAHLLVELGAQGLLAGNVKDYPAAG